MGKSSVDEICGVMVDMSTLSSFIGAGAKLAGFEEVSWACGHLKLPLLIPSLFQKGSRGWDKRPFTSAMLLSGGVLMSGKSFQKISGRHLGDLFNQVADAQGGVAIFLLGLTAGIKVFKPGKDDNRVEQGAICVRRTLTLLGSMLEGVDFSTVVVTSIKLVDGGIGTGHIYWKLHGSST